MGQTQKVAVSMEWVKKRSLEGAMKASPARVERFDAALRKADLLSKAKTILSEGPIEKVGMDLTIAAFADELAAINFAKTAARRVG